jgi:hypothetical protein
MCGGTQIISQFFMLIDQFEDLIRSNITVFTNKAVNFDVLAEFFQSPPSAMAIRVR